MIRYSDEELESLLQDTESDLVERKESWKGDTPDGGKLSAPENPPAITIGMAMMWIHDEIFPSLPPKAVRAADDRSPIGRPGIRHK